MSIRVFFAWYDCWVGVYVDRKSKVTYICLLPMICIAIQRKHVQRNQEDH